MRLSPAVCRERLAAADHAYLASISSGDELRPHLVPVVFALTGDELVIAIDQKPKSTTDLRRLRNIAANPNVTVLCDRYAADWRQLWWVRADGRARVDAANPAAIELLAVKYPQYVLDPPRGPVITVTIEHWSGWSFS
ncbi:TIGR03668 family PPOX class F420-dependent oxidoreductase [Kribbella sp. CA-293567]|uniref:TIGR03668 family PPOX class F420-dependent oxidoreductase n=1 Tax=Kribbella sp. CA-293567 TaxID=3002436 RepID=UPI0022DD1C84|nr:TIGR03668 family PPOX class F420-dependent oxidoreductase [Kribbella sp. CA-293567]WBQ06115.1 TIGR03668 family PPOX class F420-dependent oxidoreductase [Kribbella sp. CA-293567]